MCTLKLYEPSCVVSYKSRRQRCFSMRSVCIFVSCATHLIYTENKKKEKFTMANLQDISEDVYKKIYKMVDVPFTEKILRDSENKPNLKVISVSIKPATNKGDNYTSDMFRAFVEYSCQGENKTKTLVVKVVPLTEGAHQDMVSNSYLFTTEIDIMSDTLPKMNETLGPDCPPLNGRVFYTQKKNPSVLVIEDLAPLGFRKPDRQGGLDVNHCLLAIRNLARFHASSVALLERDPGLKSKYNNGLFSMNQPEEIKNFFNFGARQIAQDIATWPEVDPNISKKFSKLAETIFDKGYTSSRCRENEFVVLCHGDASVNNMLFKYDEANRPIEQIFVDFQLCLYTSPAIDLTYFFNTSLTDETLTLNEERLLEEYTQTLAATMTQTNCSTKPPSLEEVKIMMRDRAIYGLVTSVCVLPMMLVNREEVNGVNEALEKGENSSCKGTQYFETMIRRLPKFDQMGLLD